MTACPKENRPEKQRSQRLKETQIAFSAHIRDPERKAAPSGIEDRRMKIYRDLFFSNIQSLLSSNFPVIRTLYDDDSWQELVRDFYSEHRCQTPLFPEVAKEFLRYLQDGRGQRPEDPPFLLELAHYEWVELALDLDEKDLDDIPHDPDGDLMAGIPVLSPLAWPLSYRFPVHLIRPEYRPDKPGSETTELLVYRNREHEVKFIKLNKYTKYLIELIKNNLDQPGKKLIDELAATIRHPDPNRLISAAVKVMEELRSKDILLGTRPVASR